MPEHSSRSLKVTLSVLFVVALAVLGFVILTGGSTKKETATTQPSAATNQSQTGTAAATSTSSTTPTITMSEAQKQFKAIQDQVNAGTLSQEEATKLMQELGPKIAPPPIPADAKK